MAIQAVVNETPFETYDPVVAIIIRTEYHDYEQPLTLGRLVIDISEIPSSKEPG